MRLRQLQARLYDALGDTPVVWLTGAPRTGKTSLVRALQEELPAGGPNLADPVTLAWAQGDPAGFLASLPAMAMLDDVDAAPGLLPLLKASVERGGRFLLTSSRPLPGLERDLGWRMERFTLWPLAQAELRGVFPGLVDACFQGEPARLRLEPMDRAELLSRLLTGGYAEVQDRPPALREAWFHDYFAALVRGPLSPFTDLRDGRQLIRLLAAPAADPEPAKRCLDLLADLHVVAALGARYRGFNDPALQARVLGMTAAGLETRPVLAAPLLETFMVMELVKTAPWSQSRPSLTMMDTGGQPMLVLENHRRQLVAVIVNASATVQPEAFLGLRALRDQVGARFKAGLVLHAGEQLRAAGPGLWAAPFQALWAARA
jgi:hypothetical protein